MLGFTLIHARKMGPNSVIKLLSVRDEMITNLM